MNLSGWKRFPGNASFAIGAFAACWVVAAGFLALVGGRPAVRELGVDGAIVVFGLAIAMYSRIEARRTGEQVHPWLGAVFFISLIETCTHLPDVFAFRPLGVFWLAIFLLAWARAEKLARNEVRTS